MTKQYNKPPRVTPSFVVLWNYRKELGEKNALLFATASAAKQYWRRHSGRQLKEADIQRYSFKTKAEMLNAIQNLMGA